MFSPTLVFVRKSLQDNCDKTCTLTLEQFSYILDQYLIYNFSWLVYKGVSVRRRTHSIYTELACGRDVQLTTKFPDGINYSLTLKCEYMIGYIYITTEEYKVVSLFI